MVAHISKSEENTVIHAETIHTDKWFPKYPGSSPGTAVSAALLLPPPLLLFSGPPQRCEPQMFFESVIITQLRYGCKKERHASPRAKSQQPPIKIFLSSTKSFYCGFYILFDMRSRKVILLMFSLAASCK